MIPGVGTPSEGLHQFLISARFARSNAAGSMALGRRLRKRLVRATVLKTDEVEMVKQRTAEEAMNAVADAQEQVIQDGGTIHEDAIWDASEMALDGASKESMVQRLKQARAKACVPTGGWGPGRSR
jgi:hypothetical protein